MVNRKIRYKVSETDYVSHLIVLPNVVVAGLTDSSIVSLSLKLDSQSVVAQPQNSTNTAGLAPLPSTPMGIVSCDTSGKIRLYDLRARGPQQQFDALDSNLKVTSMSTSNFGELAIGTEAGPDAQVLIYDVRQIKAAKPLVHYKDSHNDDVTDLEFHSSVKHRLVSGSTDGVVNLFNTSIEDEDDAVIQAFNHQASIHRAGFFSDSHEAVRSLRIDDSRTRDKIFALSHMETLTVYPVGFEDELNADVNQSSNAESTPPYEFGDLRKAWNCQYVADYRKQHFLIGSNDEQWASIVPILDGKPQDPVKLEGGHGEDVVRCFDIWQPSQACYTGGEDGCINLWDVTDQFDQAEEFTSKASTATKKSSKSNKVLSRKDPLRKKKSKNS